MNWLRVFPLAVLSAGCATSSATPPQAPEARGIANAQDKEQQTKPAKASDAQPLSEGSPQPEGANVAAKANTLRSPKEVEGAAAYCFTHSDLKPGEDPDWSFTYCQVQADNCSKLRSFHLDRPSETKASPCTPVYQLWCLADGESFCQSTKFRCENIASSSPEVEEDEAICTLARVGVEPILPITPKQQASIDTWIAMWNEIGNVVAAYPKQCAQVAAAVAPIVRPQRLLFLQIHELRLSHGKKRIVDLSESSGAGKAIDAFNALAPKCNNDAYHAILSTLIKWFKGQNIEPKF